MLLHRICISLCNLSRFLGDLEPFSHVFCLLHTRCASNEMESEFGCVFSKAMIDLPNFVYGIKGHLFKVIEPFRSYNWYRGDLWGAAKYLGN